MHLTFGRMRAVGRFAAACCAVMLISGCSSWFEDEYADIACPQARILNELSTVSRYTGSGTDFVNLSYRATLKDLTSKCTVDETGASVEVGVTTVAQMGPTAPDRAADFPYFIAITDGRDRIIAKKVFDNHIVFPPNESRAGATDTLTQKIPMRDPHDADVYHVIVGFQLTQQELNQNRALSR